MHAFSTGELQKIDYEARGVETWDSQEAM